MKRAADLFTKRKSSELEALLHRLTSVLDERHFESLDKEISDLTARLGRSGKVFIDNKFSEFDSMANSLRMLDPEMPLERGYSLVTVEKSGTFLRNPDEVMNGDGLRVRVKSGEIRAKVVRK